MKEERKYTQAQFARVIQRLLKRGPGAYSTSVDLLLGDRDFLAVVRTAVHHINDPVDGRSQEEDHAAKVIALLQAGIEIGLMLSRETDA